MKPSGVSLGTMVFIAGATCLAGSATIRAESLEGTGETTLVAWWPADTTANDVIGGRIGVLTGDAGYADGYCGCGFQLDGDGDLVSVEDIRILPDTFSVALWMNVSAHPLPDDYYVVIRFKHATQFFLGYSNYSARPGPQLVATFRDAAFQWHLPVDGSLFLGEWAHVAATYNGGDRADSTSFALYVNGEPLSFDGSLRLGQVGGQCNDNAFGADILGACGENFHYYPGLLDEIRVYDGVLSAEEVSDLYLDPCTAPDCPVSSVPEPDMGAETKVLLSPPAPNPFIPLTAHTAALRFQVQGRAGAQVPLRLEIVAPTGQIVRTLVSRSVASGDHVVTWDGLNERREPANSGVYFCRLRTGGRASSHQVVLIR